MPRVWGGRCRLRHVTSSPDSIVAGAGCSRCNIMPRDAWLPPASRILPSRHTRVCADAMHAVAGKYWRMTQGDVSCAVSSALSALPLSRSAARAGDALAHLKTLQDRSQRITATTGQLRFAELLDDRFGSMTTALLCKRRLALQGAELSHTAWTGLWGHLMRPVRCAGAMGYCRYTLRILTAVCLCSD